MGTFVRIDVDQAQSPDGGQLRHRAQAQGLQIALQLTLCRAMRLLQRGDALADVAQGLRPLQTLTQRGLQNRIRHLQRLRAPLIVQLRELATGRLQLLACPNQVPSLVQALGGGRPPCSLVSL